MSWARKAGGYEGEPGRALQGTPARGMPAEGWRAGVDQPTRGQGAGFPRIGLGCTKLHSATFGSEDGGKDSLANLGGAEAGEAGAGKDPMDPEAKAFRKHHSEDLEGAPEDVGMGNFGSRRTSRDLGRRGNLLRLQMASQPEIQAAVRKKCLEEPGPTAGGPGSGTKHGSTAALDATGG